jgi:hypothetical protein
MTHESGSEYFIHDILARRRLRGRQGANPNNPRRFEYLTHWDGERQDETTWERYEQFVTDGVVAQPLLDFIQQQQQQHQQTPDKEKSVTPKKSKPSRRKLKAKSKSRSRSRSSGVTVGKCICSRSLVHFGSSCRVLIENSLRHARGQLLAKQKSTVSTVGLSRLKKRRQEVLAIEIFNTPSTWKKKKTSDANEHVRH